jgi:hypothetical protein
MPIFKGEELLFNEIMSVDNVNLGYIVAIRYNDIILYLNGQSKNTEFQNLE